MNPYLAPDMEMYACCDAGTQFTNTNFFSLGNHANESFETLFRKNEEDALYNLIRNMGITNIASYVGMKAREIITYSKCELCRKLFNSSETVAKLRVEIPELNAWSR